MFNNNIQNIHISLYTKGFLEDEYNRNKRKGNLLHENPKSNFTIWTSAESEDLCIVIVKAGIIRNTGEKEQD